MDNVDVHSKYDVPLVIIGNRNKDYFYLIVPARVFYKRKDGSKLHSRNRAMQKASEYTKVIWNCPTKQHMHNGICVRLSYKENESEYSISNRLISKVCKANLIT